MAHHSEGPTYLLPGLWAMACLFHAGLPAFATIFYFLPFLCYLIAELGRLSVVLKRKQLLKEPCAIAPPETPAHQPIALLRDHHAPIVEDTLPISRIHARTAGLVRSSISKVQLLKESESPQQYLNQRYYATPSCETGIHAFCTLPAFQ